MEKDRYRQLLDAIEHERKAEETYYRVLSAKKTLKEKIEAGILVGPLEIKKKYYTIGDFVEIQLSQRKDSNLPNKLTVGVGVNLFFQAEETKYFRGTLSYKKRDQYGIIIQQDVILQDQIPDHANFYLELIYDERPYKVMKNAILEVMDSKIPEVVSIREGIREKKGFEGINNHALNALYLDKSLNKDQQESVSTMFHAEEIGIIHGPPGTGKTTTLVALVKALSKVEKRILVCAPSNNAVDLLAEKIHEKDISVLRVGNVTRINDRISHLTLEEKSRNHPDWNHIKQVRIEAEAARKMANTFKRKFGSKQRKERTDMYRESRELNKWARDIQNRILTEITKNSKVIVSTLIGLSHSSIKDLKYDTVIIDEASQCLEPEVWNAILKAKRVILAGDHHQLPPTVKSPEAIKLGLDVTLLDRMTPIIKHVHLLTVQYRMNDAILGFSNDKFYNGNLVSAEENKNHKLPNDQQPLLFIDTSGSGYQEKRNEKNNSLSNEGEYYILREFLIQNINLIKNASIGIISPYAEQVRHIRNHLLEEPEFHNLDVEVNSIDGFQGQEKDVIIISLTRSNEMGEIGFLKDYRRLNVAMTRAKKKLVIIGDGATLCHHELYNDVINYIEENGILQSAYEYMSF